MRIRQSADLARLVKTGRQTQGRTQQDVAEAAGITRQSLARIERGHGGVSFTTVILILDYLGIRLEGTSVDTTPTSATGPAGIDDAIRRSLDTSGLTTPFRKSLNGLSDQATRAVLRSAIEAGDPDSSDAGGKSTPVPPKSDERSGR